LEEKNTSAFRYYLTQATIGAITGGTGGALRALLPLFLWPVFLLLLLTLLIFIALPNMLFGYASAADEKVVAMTEQAAIIQSAYEVIDASVQARIEEIIAKTEEESIDENGNSTYDRLDVNSFVENTNTYWFIAICSVAHKQDLYVMDAGSVRNLVVTKIFWSSHVLLETDESSTTRVLVVDIADFDPQGLMHTLNFTEEEKNWATVLYTTLVDYQFVSTSGYLDGIDLSDFEFTEISTPVVYYSQLDSRWVNKSYGKTGTLGEEGCGPTAAAMVIATLADTSVNPVDIAKWSAQNGYRAEGNGSYLSLVPAVCSYYGLTVEGIGNDAKKLVSALNQGYLVIAIMSKGHFTTGGHFIVLRGLTTSGEVLVADPASTSRSNKSWALSIITMEARRGAGSGGPFWVVSA